MPNVTVEAAKWDDVPQPNVRTNYVRFIAVVRIGALVLPDFARGAALRVVLDLAVQSDADGSRDRTV